MKNHDTRYLPLLPVEHEFFLQPTLKLAQALLGCLLIKETEEGVSRGFIVETEAYMGPKDQAAHSFNNRRTKRTEVMFGEAGLVYTYVMHTHCLVNVVSGHIDKPEAILIRAVEPFIGKELIKVRRGMDNLVLACNGPGKLTKALGITMDDYGKSFRDSTIYIAEGFSPLQISSGPRVGIPNSGEAKDYPWRYWITGNRFVSRS
ncbi:DNA-3-methyladenine glycosylase [Peribacillus alkalitolerans]|uniref:DNA-3-methyladenine glycosylase n=1 Tax=Peribacillus alkalitolerans TaxID=1550385 RepID=UPI0013D43DE4|nr:DNA-3-methyladenine glycosylase [Peribacillus alkalitolerans]